jgi:hypothetical protein
MKYFYKYSRAGEEDASIEWTATVTRSILKMEKPTNAKMWVTRAKEYA